MLKITFYYNDGREYENELTTLQEAQAIECGVLRGLYSIALDDPENFKKHFVIGYKLENEKGEIVDSHIYKKVEALKQPASKKAKWIEDGYYKLPCVCSYCGHEGRYDMKICNNCGAEMEGK